MADLYRTIRFHRLSPKYPLEWSHLTLQVEGRLDFRHWKRTLIKRYTSVSNEPLNIKWEVLKLVTN